MATYRSQLYRSTAQVRRSASNPSPGADVVYSAAINVTGNWEEAFTRGRGVAGGWQDSGAPVFITSGQIAGTSTFIVPNREDLFFRPGVDATNENNGQLARDIYTAPDLQAASGTVHHFEVML